MKKQLSKILIATLVFASLSSALAEPLNAEKGFYFSANAGVAGAVGHSQEATEYDYINGKWSYKNFKTKNGIGFGGVGGNLYTGYRFNKYTA